jgi:D-sedoheptulose 7-phosphate isomerase
MVNPALDDQPSLAHRRLFLAQATAFEMHKDPMFLPAWLGIVRKARECLASGGKILTIGNGGSHCHALHLAEELTGRYGQNRAPIAALCIDGGAPHMSCVSNDYSFDEVYERMVQALAKPGDVLIIFSTSGMSNNLVLAAHAMKVARGEVIAFLGKDGGKTARFSDSGYIVPSHNSAEIQEMHQILLHALVEEIEAA